MMMYLLSTAVLALQTVAAPVEAPEKGPHTVNLPTGIYEGNYDANASTTTYFNIPYAFADRFEVPKPAEERTPLTSDKHFDATKHGPACVNFNLPSPYDTGFSALLGDQAVKPQSEQCLNLDVYVPDGEHRDLPVLVFTPGGGFLVGGSFIYDMKPLMTHAVSMGQPFIGVVLNYRLGPLGFLNPSTWGEDINLGILDQIEGLRWVKRNIAAFGGDPSKVTISKAGSGLYQRRDFANEDKGGESAGGESTLHQFLWTDETLFRSAWMMSIPSSGVPFLSHSPEPKDDLLMSFGKACGCKDKNIGSMVKCLRNTDVGVMVNQSTAWEGSQTSLGGIIRRNVFDEVRSGKWPKVPMVLSMTRDEGTVLAYGFKPNSTAETKLQIGQLISGANLKGGNASQFMKEMLDTYPNDPALGAPFDGKDTNYGAGSQYKRVAAIGTDGTWAEAWSEYLESFSDQTKVWGLTWEQPPPRIPPVFGSLHGGDLYFYFPTLAGKDQDPRLAGQSDLVSSLMTALTHFVTWSDPNGCATKAQSDYVWPEYGCTGNVTAMDAADIAKSILPAHRPGFDVLHKFLRPGQF